VPKSRSRKRSRPLRSFDFFCGAGGLTRGLRAAGIRVLAGFDNDKECRLSYEKNNPGAKFVGKDIRDVTIAELKRRARVKSFKNMLFAGCAPCSPFSKKRKVETPSEDLTLLMAFGRIISRAKPGYVLVENVPGIANARGYSTFRRFIRLLEKSGYRHRIEYDVLDAKRFGIPQTRRRLVLIATRKGKPSLPTPKFGTEHRPFKTVRQTIARFPIIRAGSRHKEIQNHVASVIGSLNLERLRATPQDGGDWRDWPEELRLQCHLGDDQSYSDSYGRMSWDSPAPTLTGRCHSISNGRYGHPTQCRAISLREAAALQTFPDGYRFFGPHTHIALQIGNAVPVRLAKELGKHILWLRSQEPSSNGRQAHPKKSRNS
jgi:DNA (cytosine-5)-methyltransferase 1